MSSNLLERSQATPKVTRGNVIIRKDCEGHLWVSNTMQVLLSLVGAGKSTHLNTAHRSRHCANFSYFK